MTGEVVLHGEVVTPPPPPTSRDEIIRADLARGVPHDLLAAEWGLDPAVIEYIASTIRNEPTPVALEPVPQSYDRLLARIDPRDGDPEEEQRDPRAFSYHRNRLSESTRRGYRRYGGYYLDYCAGTGRREIPGHRFTIEAFTIWLTEREVTRGKNKGRTGMAPASIGVALAAVAALHRACGENIPDRDLARKIVESHKKQRARDRVPDDVGSPAVDLPTFRELVLSCDPRTNAGLRDRAMLTLGLNIMARRSELCVVDVADLKVERGGKWLSVHVPVTKTGKPRTAKVPKWDDDQLCPITAWEAWRQRLSDVGLSDGPAFRAVDRWDNIQGTDRWAGRCELGVRLDGSTLEHIVLRAALKAGVENADELSPHGVLRRTGATIAYQAGADILSIARQGGWGDRSPVVFKYIADIDQYKRNPMLLIGKEG